MDRYEITLSAFDLLEHLPPAISNRASDIIRNIDDSYKEELREEMLHLYWKNYTDAVGDLLFMIHRMNRRHVYALGFLDKAFETKTPFILYLRDFSIGRHHVWTHSYHDSATGRPRCKFYEVMPFDDQFVQQSVLKYAIDQQILALSVQDFHSFDVSRKNPARQAMVSLLLPNSDWNAVTDFLISQAGAIVLTVREFSAGTRLEITQIHRHRKHGVTIIVRPKHYAFEQRLDELNALTKDIDLRGPEIPPPVEREALTAVLGEIKNIVEFTEDFHANDQLFTSAIARIGALQPVNSSYEQFRRTFGPVGIEEHLSPDFIDRLTAEIDAAEAFLSKYRSALSPFAMVRSLFDLLCLHVIRDDVQGIATYLMTIYCFFAGAEPITAAEMRIIAVKFISDVEDLTLDEAETRFNGAYNDLVSG